MSDARLGLVRAFAEDRWRAHRELFRHRHPDEGSLAHREMVERFHDFGCPRLSIEGFRGFAKTTTAEEGIILKALYREFHNGVVLGPSSERARDKVDAIANELVVNPLIEEIYGPQKGVIWSSGRIVLTNGVCIQALGRDQSITGIKFRDWRPDFLLADDIEDPEEQRNDADRLATWGWFLRTLLPSLDDPVGTPIRHLGTRRGTGSLPERLERAGWPVVKYPIEHVDREGKRAATWPARFPLSKVDLMRRDYRGDMHTWAQEYMCEAMSEVDRAFPAGIFRAEPRVREPWRPVFAMYDPARTARRESATTGIAVWSYIGGSRLRFWRLAAEQWLPDRIIDDIFAVNREYRPVWIGFEEDGLNEWARQPIRAEMLKRRVLLPLLPVKAPRNKLDFILSLRSFAVAGEIEFAGLPEAFAVAADQFGNFPRGRIDAPNAAAYALLLRPGAPVYEFDERCVVEGLEAEPGTPLYLAGNSDGRIVTAVLVQRIQGELRVLADWVREGAAAEVAAEIHAEAQLMAETGRWTERDEYDAEQPYKMPVKVRSWERWRLRWVVPHRHTEEWHNVGLIQAIRLIPQGVAPAPLRAEERGRVDLAERLRLCQRGRGGIAVSAAAGWTCRALAGGYARPVDGRGLSGLRPDSGIYACLAEGLEAFCGVGMGGERGEVESQQPLAYTRDGTPYRSAMPDRRARRG